MLSNCNVGEDSRVPWTTRRSNQSFLKKKKKKKNQPWIFTGRTDAEAEAPILWPPDMKSHLLGKDPDAGKDWRQKQKGAAEDETVRQHHWLSGVWASSRRQRRTEGPGVLRSLGSQTVKHDSVTEQQQQNPQRAIIKRTPRFSCSVPKGNTQLQFPFQQNQKIRTGGGRSLLILEL